MAGLVRSRGNSASSWILGRGQALTFFHYLLDVLLLILLLLSVGDLHNMILRFRNHDDLSTISAPSLFFPCGFSVGGAGSSWGFSGVFSSSASQGFNRERNISLELISNFSDSMFCDFPSFRTGSCTTNYTSGYMYFPLLPPPRGLH